ncbi:hypothetical protein [Liquorilactobacillus mali]|uniref:Uncharacterized protein n=1 Tax=Liquorilactobacillus mali KCTC 3596 = DSM 20444 TaxID=1046596 RepID=J0L1Y0_9LACO|nr:hypothetical protein [Liquorilactobacillus mali]EJF02182.1 hypothetical protein LMA_10578 [Liquorilactobacillus mali KCTC 3596 = DSM 20444]KRN03486.1 hypothetical protein FD00_GL000500 [Liquorilactobacillus mali KCTC 3596 = DSM 20444]QFQ74556.1 hypothetical protein LM596_05240 [Liquorilactobacillus mali]
MIKNDEPAYYVIPKESFVAERRVFKQGEEYPVYRISGGFCLVAENGEFNFTKKLFSKVLHDWELEVVEDDY